MPPKVAVSTHPHTLRANRRGDLAVAQVRAGQDVHSTQMTRLEATAVQDRERERLARELHDGIGQLLAALRVGLRSLEDTRSLRESKQRATTLKQVADRMLGELRLLTRGLHPVMVLKMGLRAAVKDLVAEFSQAHGVRVELATDALQSLRLEPPAQVALFRITQEALSNIAKHAAATQASVNFQLRPSELHLTIEDNGRGLPSSDLDDLSDGHFGLHSMRERAQLLGGQLWVRTTSKRGTAVRAVIPLPQGRQS